MMDKSLSSLLTRIYGTKIFPLDDGFVQNAIEKRMTSTRKLSLEIYLANLAEDIDEQATLLGSFQNNYSEFFRNPLSYAVLESIILPWIIKEKSRAHNSMIRIWSAACATGQEPYSLAMLLEEAKKEYHDRLPYILVASDKDELTVMQAEQGRYHQSALNRVTLNRLNKWFTISNKEYLINPALKKNIIFSVFDLLDNSLASPPSGIFGNFDIVFCANLLFYYKNDFHQIIIEKLSNSLADNGFLITGETERDIMLAAGFREVFPNTAIFQRKI